MTFAEQIALAQKEADSKMLAKKGIANVDDADMYVNSIASRIKGGLLGEAKRCPSNTAFTFDGFIEGAHKYSINHGHSDPADYDRIETHSLISLKRGDGLYDGGLYSGDYKVSLNHNAMEIMKKVNDTLNPDNIRIKAFCISIHENIVDIDPNRPLNISVTENGLNPTKHGYMFKARIGLFRVIRFTHSECSGSIYDFIQMGAHIVYPYE